MLISYRELGRWVDLDGIDDVDELAHRMTMAGLEVEGVDHFGQGHDDIVVGRIEAIEEHPNADRLVVCRVDVGGDDLRQIVCGATNMAEGDLVPVALPGSQPPAVDFQIVEREVMDVVSQGMLCSDAELGFADEAEGLMILDDDLAVGTPIFEALRLVDTHFDIGLTPNRPDCLSHLGVAREVAAIYGAERDHGPLDIDPAWEGGESTVGDVASLRVEDEGCPRYIAAVIEDIVVGPSPTWLQRMVTAMGMRSINNVVDVTNVVLADVGQPLHAFDLDTLNDHAIVVRRAREGESIVGIDHQEYALDSADLVIADSERPVAIAGVMGGEATEVTEETTRILVECAYFEPTTVRRTSKRLGLHTESSHRFERGIDPGATRTNIAYAIELLLRTQQDVGDEAVVRSGILEHHPHPWTPTFIEVPAQVFRRILGVDLDDETVERILSALEIDVERTEDGWRASPPSFRPDLERPIDLVEEVARLWGYDRFEATLPDSKMGAAHERLPQQKHHDTIVARSELRTLEAIRIRMLAAGLHEAINYSFFGEEALERLELDAQDERSNPPRVANPLTQDQALMRTTLVPGLLQSLQTNIAQRESDVALFEIGRTFHRDRTEKLQLGIVATGATRQHFDEGRPWDFFDLKGLVESLAGEQVGRGVWRRPKDPEPYMHPGVQAQWFVDGRWIGRVGQLHPRLAAELELDAPVLLAELDMDALVEMEQSAPEFQAFPKYPAVRRDFALLYAREAEYTAIETAVHDFAERDAEFGRIFDRFRLFDVYEGEQVPEDQRSLAVEVVYRSAERTLTDDEVADADQRLLRWLQSETGAVLR